MENKYADMGVLYYLTQYVISMSNTGLGIGNIQSGSFQSDEDFYAFVDDLIKFYQDMFLTSIQSPLGFDGNFNVNQLFENYQYEALHMYINQGVERQVRIIDTLSKDKNPSDFAAANM